MRNKRNKPYKISKNKKAELKSKLLGVKREAERKNAKKALKKSGKHSSSSKSKTSRRDMAPEKKLLTGEFTAHARGFGFVTVEGYDEDFFIPESNVNAAMHKDTVRISLCDTPKGKRKEARIEEIVSHNVERIVGTFTKMNGFGFVIPDDKKFCDDLYIPSDAFLGAKNNDKVVVMYTQYADGIKKPEGRIVEIIGGKDDPGADILSIVKAMDIPSEFPVGCLDEANHVNKPVKKKQIKNRLDLREIPMVTIDGDETKDFDDAVSVGIEGDNYILGVHIADVAEYVCENGALDEEAIVRGTSVYLCDRVIPMLPKALSNGICSLNEGEDRLALSCIMKINKSGQVIDYTIDESVINVDKRMTYHNVSMILEGDEELAKEYGRLVPHFFAMKELSDIIRKARHAKGCIDFDFPEAEILLHRDGTPKEIKSRDRDIASLMIEDFMILANETVARCFDEKEIPFMYRTHGAPDADRVLALNDYTQTIGITIRPKGVHVSPKEIQEVLKKIKGRPEEEVINHMVLRAMQKAKYNTECEGHFGLASEYYCHFTSPIRRYPDLQIHRIIKDYLHGEMDKKRMKHYKKLLPERAERCSVLERRADEAERETDKMKEAEYMMAHIGEEFVGSISGVTGFGIYVELPNTIEGLVHITALTGDYFRYDEERQELVGERTKLVYRIGQKVRVKVDNANKDTRTIDFVLSENQYA